METTQLMMPDRNLDYGKITQKLPEWIAEKSLDK